MNAPVSTTNIALKTAVSDEVIVNRDGSTGVQTTSDLALQLASSWPLQISGNAGKLFTTYAALAATAHGEFTPWVYADPDVSRNGMYRWNGAGWEWSLPLPYSFLIASNVGTGTTAAIKATTLSPVSSAALILLPIAVDYVGEAATVSFNGAAALAIKTNSGEDVLRLDGGSVVYGVISGETFRLANDEAIASLIYAARDEAIAAEDGAQLAQAGSEAARDIAAGYASDAVSQGNVPIYGTVVGMPELEIPAGINTVRVNGGVVAGDGKGGIYVDHDNGRSVAFVTAGTTSRSWYRADDSIGAAIWSGGTFRTMQERGRDIYCILDAPGQPDPSGNNDSTLALEAMAASGVKGELTVGSFVATRKIVLKPGVVWDGYSAPTLKFNLADGGFIFDSASKIIMAGSGLKEHTIAGATSRSVPNPDAGAAYLADSGTRGNTYRNVDYTQPFSAGVILDKGCRFNNIGVYANFDGLLGYMGNDGRLSDDWDVGVWSRNADWAGGENGVSYGHWRKAALLVSSHDIGDGIVPSAESQRWTGWKLQGFWGLSIRSPEATVGSNWGFADTIFQNCDIRSLCHQSGHLATSSIIQTPFSSPSGCIDIAGAVMARVNFFGGRRMGWDDVCDFFGHCEEIFFDMVYGESKSVKVNGSELPGSVGSRNVAFVGAGPILYKNNRKFAVDTTPHRPRDVALPGRYTVAATGVFNPTICIDDDSDEQRFASWSGPRVGRNQGWRVTNENNTVLAQLSNGGILSFPAGGSILFPTATTTELASVTSQINTENKFLWKIVWNSTTGILMRARGGSATASWGDMQNGSTITPA
ncbi:hypothetical protein [Rhizobium nepotum]|uniref:Uncharacterized protein n=1 Tax=Rhizobium nepotum 39/7 TaxID=1368418 RepID=A0ABR5CRF1_9HYPH|nr:hypothetical protein [Rhizobium nepotum]KJF67397.1 hypothetical protein RS75_13020 [Rhizobium nepotum 39/7]